MKLQKLIPVVVVSILLVGLLGVSFAPGRSQEPGPGQPQVEAGVQVGGAAGEAATQADPAVTAGAVLHLGAEAFQPYYLTTTWTRSDLLLRATGSGTQPFDAPLMLPNGATINQIVTYFVDNDAGTNLSVYFVRHAANSTLGVATKTAVSSGASSNVRYITMTGFTEKIDTGTNSYFIRINLPAGANVSFNSVRVDYGYGAALPIAVNQ